MSELSRPAGPKDRSGGLFGQENIVEICPKKIFDYASACQILPIVIRLTETYCEKVNILLQRKASLSASEQSEQDREVNSLIDEWQTKMEKLGPVSKGLWMLDFDTGDGYFCWKFPESRILYWHGYRDGFSGRRSVEEYLETRRKRSSEEIAETKRDRALTEL